MSNEDVSAIKREYDLLKQEVDALQIAVMASRQPWYKSIPTIISITALLFSFGTTAESYFRTKQQSVHADRLELRSLLQRLAALPKEDIEIKLKHSNNVQNISVISGFIAQENTLLSRQASEIASKLSDSHVSATEYYAIAIALENAFNLKGSRDFYTKAINSKSDITDKITALRGRANNYFNTGDAQSGRVDYQTALNLFPKNDAMYNDFIRKSFDIWTEINWSYAEANIGDKVAAIQHLDAAKKLVDSLSPGPATAQFEASVQQARALFLEEKAPFAPVAPPQSQSLGGAAPIPAAKK
ncbi:hypothetical protein [Bosea sp. BH3]|uniref:hypothetical protein n=1 Tax=Bosea sp. BH3 TaxID=2871701 RepID=UPI0021CB4838|nr:hypothetical protein [Bosea sp. BH3]MCU4178544.1 hypothetical protein [Bosea sp. BH3]